MDKKSKKSQRKVKEMSKKPSPSEEKKPLKFLLSSPLSVFWGVFLTFCEYFGVFGEQNLHHLSTIMEEKMIKIKLSEREAEVIQHGEKTLSDQVAELAPDYDYSDYIKEINNIQTRITELTNITLN